MKRGAMSLGFVGSAIAVGLPTTAAAAAGAGGALIDPVVADPLALAAALAAGAVAAGFAAWHAGRRRISGRADQAEARAAQLSAILDDAPALCLRVGPNDEVLSCSPGVNALLGPDAASIRSLGELSSMLEPGSFVALRQGLAEVRRSGSPFSAIVQTTGRHGALDVRATRIAADGGDRDELVVWFSDPSRFDSVRAQAATLEGALDERDWLDQVLAGVPLPVWRRGGDLSLTRCNRAYARLVECAPDEAIARGVELSTTSGPGRARSLAMRARDTGEAQTETLHVAAAGERRLVAITESPLAPGGDVLGFARDVTDVEEARADLTRHIDAHSAVLEALTTAVAIFGGDARLKFYNRAYARWEYPEFCALGHSD